MRVPVRLAIDAMSGDHGYPVAVAAALSVLDENERVELILVGDEASLRDALRKQGRRDESRLRIRHATEVVAMDEAPSKALRNKKDSSMRVAIDLVKAGEADAAVSAGNTGALMATAKFVLKTLPGIDRPAIISKIPSMNGHVHMLDLGANAECSAEQLLQFAVMGSALVTATGGVARPSIGLLNIGEEEIKGNEVIRQAAQLLQATSLNYVGFVEGDGVFLKDIDVVVCDGFTGNIALKTGEGVAKMFYHFLKQAFSRSVLTKMAAVVALPVLKALAGRLDPRNYNGASLVGLNGIVIKSHGSADMQAFAAAIRVAHREVENDVRARIRELMALTLPAAGLGAKAEAAVAG